MNPRDRIRQVYGVGREEGGGQFSERWQVNRRQELAALGGGSFQSGGQLGPHRFAGRRQERLRILQEALGAVDIPPDEFEIAARRLEDRTLIAVVPRLMNHGLPEGQRIPIGRDVWKDTGIILSEESITSTYRDVFSGARMKAEAHGSLSAADLFRTLPVALLVSEEL